MKQYDLVVVGAGAVGATLALVFGQLGKKVLLIEKNACSTATLDNVLEGRTFALSYASTKIYQALGIWEDLQSYAGAIKQVRVNMRGHYGSCLLDHKMSGVPALGYVIGVDRLENALTQALDHCSSVDVLYSTEVENSSLDENNWHIQLKTSSSSISLVNARLIVACDGVNSLLRQRMFIDCEERDYGHHAIMCNLRLPHAPPGVALERFLPKGAIALLPWRAGWATCVWTLETKDARHYYEAPENQFIEHAQQTLGSQWGKIDQIGKRYFFPLKMKLAHLQFASRFLLMGNAAHSLHPIAAQGLNLSLRDIWQLRMQLKQNGIFDVGDEQFIAHYIRGRQNDQNRVILATDKIARFMANNQLAARWRAMGLVCFDELFPAKQWFTRYSMGVS